MSGAKQVQRLVGLVQSRGNRLEPGLDRPLSSSCSSGCPACPRFLSRLNVNIACQNHPTRSSVLIVLFFKKLDGMAALSTLPPVALLAKSSKIRFHSRTLVGEGHDVVDVKNRAQVACWCPTAKNAAKFVPRKHPAFPN